MEKLLFNRCNLDFFTGLAMSVTCSTCAPYCVKTTLISFFLAKKAESLKGCTIVLDVNQPRSPPLTAEFWSTELVLANSSKSAPFLNRPAKLSAIFLLVHNPDFEERSECGGLLQNRATF